VGLSRSRLFGGINEGSPLDHLVNIPHIGFMIAICVDSAHAMGLCAQNRRALPIPRSKIDGSAYLSRRIITVTTWSAVDPDVKTGSAPRTPGV